MKNDKELKIDQHKFCLTQFTVEIEGELDPNKRVYVISEADVYEEALRNNQDGTFNKVYKAKMVGGCKVEQQGEKPQVGKRKMTTSQQLRAAFWHLNPEEEFYRKNVNRIMDNLEEVIDYLDKLN